MQVGLEQKTGYSIDHIIAYNMHGNDWLIYTANTVMFNK